MQKAKAYPAFGGITVSPAEMENYLVYLTEGKINFHIPKL
jgi:hypothetical protein